MEIMVNDKGELVNSENGLTPDVRDAYSVSNHSISDPYGNARIVGNALQLVESASKLDDKLDGLSDSIEYHRDFLIENDLKDTVDSFDKFVKNVRGEVDSIIAERGSVFVGGDTGKAKLTAKQLKYVMGNPLVREVLSVNISSRVHEGAHVVDDLNVFSDRLGNCARKIKFVGSQLDSIVSDLTPVMDEDDDERKFLESELEEVQWELEKLRDQFEELSYRYDELRDAYDELSESRSPFDD